MDLQVFLWNIMQKGALPTPWAVQCAALHCATYLCNT